MDLCAKITARSPFSLLRLDLILILPMTNFCPDLGNGSGQKLEKLWLRACPRAGPFLQMGIGLASAGTSTSGILQLSRPPYYLTTA